MSETARLRLTVNRADFPNAEDLAGMVGQLFILAHVSLIGNEVVITMEPMAVTEDAPVVMP